MKHRAPASPDLPPVPNASGRSSAEISAAIAAARSILQSRTDALETASRAYDTALDRGRDAALEAKQWLAEAEVDRDVAQRVVENLEAEIALAKQREAAQGQIEVYKKAERLSAAATAALTRYPALAAEIADIIAEVAVAERAVAAANADLPAGFTVLPAVERAARTADGEAEQIVATEEVQAWVEQGDAMPTSIGDEHIHITSPGRGVIEVKGMPRKDWPQVELRNFSRETYIPRLAAGSVEYLAKKVCLPGFYSYDPDHWKPLVPFQGIITPSDVLRQSAELKAATREIADRDLRTRYVPQDRTRVKFVGTTSHPTMQFSPWG